MSSSGYIKVSLDIVKEQFYLFGFLLDSVEGLAFHSFNKNTNTMDVFVPKSQFSSFQSFLSAWNSSSGKLNPMQIPINITDLISEVV